MKLKIKTVKLIKEIKKVVSDRITKLKLIQPNLRVYYKDSTSVIKQPLISSFGKTKMKSLLQNAVKNNNSTKVLRTKVVAGLPLALRLLQ